MALASVLLSLAAVACTVLGIVAVIVPVLGSVLSYAAPVLALSGVVLGGVAISRARQARQESSGLALSGVILNTLAFIPALLGALTCGVCNTVLTGAARNGQSNFSYQVSQTLSAPVLVDAGVPAWQRAPQRQPDGGPQPVRVPATGLPPPPLNPGPGAR